MTALAPLRPIPPEADPPYDAPAYRSTEKRHPTHKLLPWAHTVTELTGPHFSPARFPSIPYRSVLNRHQALGKQLIGAVKVMDENGRPVPNPMIEIWQANAAGR